MSTSQTAADSFERAILDIVREATGCPADMPITTSTSFIGDLDVDSLTLVRIDTLIQEKLGESLSADEVENITTVGDLILALKGQGQHPGV